MAAGADAVIIFNEGQEGRTDSPGGTLGDPKDVPVLFTSFAVGDELAQAAQAGTVTLHVKTDTVNETRETYNVLADSKKGDTSRTLVVGSHLDSVARGPGHQRQRLGLRAGSSRSPRSCRRPQEAQEPHPLRVLGRRGVRPARLDALRGEPVAERGTRSWPT